MARADRTSEELTATQYSSILDAAAHADILGSRLNLLCTVNWQKLPDGGPSIQHWQGRWLELVSKWLKRRGLTKACVWTVERGEIASGLHLHVMINLPGRHLDAFCAMMPDWAGVAALNDEELGKLKKAGTTKVTAIARAVEGEWQVDRVTRGPNEVAANIPTTASGTLGT